MMKIRPKEKAKQKMVMETYRKYRTKADGSRVLVGVVRYRHPAGTNEPVGMGASNDWAFLEARDAADLEQRDMDCASFEDLADQACEWGE